MNAPSAYDASSSAIGYIYQIRYALFLALRKIDTVDDPDDCFVSIEKIDDISFHGDGLPAELLQTKYHATPGNLSDRSQDIWKTVRVWSEFLGNVSGAEEVTFTLITTENLAADSLANWLSPDESHRNVKKALAKMREISEETTNAANLSSYKAFKNLSPTLQNQLVASTYVIGGAQAIHEVTQAIKKKLRTVVAAQHIDSFLTRLEGAWFKRAIELLTSPSFDAIQLNEVVAIIDDLRSQFLPGNLPSDFDDALPEIIDIDSDHRVFVEQLRLIDAPASVIKTAIINYYRACEQRSRWARENLLKPGEIGKYLSRLKEEWENYKSLHEMDIGSSGEADSVRIGRKLYQSCQTDGALPIRRDFEAKYVARGSYHDLADSQKIGWHPSFSSQLSNGKEGAA